ncbi:hypothetical protein D3C74_267200 [compost metagenome]
MRSSGNWRANYDVLLPAVLMQERGVRCQQHHIQRGACVRRQFFQPFADFTFQSKHHRITCGTSHRRTCKVRRYIQHWQLIPEGFEPVRFLTLHPLLMGFALLPYRIILVLNSQWR